jgi:hypothetical protein
MVFLLYGAIPVNCPGKWWQRWKPTYQEHSRFYWSTQKFALFSESDSQFLESNLTVEGKEVATSGHQGVPHLLNMLVILLAIQAGLSSS